MTQQSPAAGATPIPLRLVGRPVVGGLAAPWVACHHIDGTPVIGLMDGSRQVTCLIRRLCQACGDALSSPLVLLARARDFAAGYVAEPGLHPECAAYTAACCPMLNGTMHRYRATPRPARQLRCGNPACPCRAWAAAGDSQHRSGHAAEPFAAVWIGLGDNRIHRASKNGNPDGITLAGARKIRLLPAAAGARGEPEDARLLSALALLTDLTGQQAPPVPGPAAASPRR
jgi:hypothetical protein